MSDALTQIVQNSQELEQRLEKRYGATGRGLHEKLTSIEAKIPSHVSSRIRKIATIRNHAVHEDTSLAEENLKAVKEAYSYVAPALKYTEVALVKIGKSLDRVQKISDDLEELLAQKYGATGLGLFAKLESVKEKLPFSAKNKIRKLATIRSKAANRDFTDGHRYIDEVIKLDQAIRDILAKSSSSPQKRQGPKKRVFQRKEDKSSQRRQDI